MLANLIEHIFKDRHGYVSRKVVAAWTLTFMATFFFCFPFFYNLTSSLRYLHPLLSAELWVQILTMIWGTYFATNAAGQWIWAIQNKGKENDRDREATPEDRGTGATE